jgi:hypothetical protein
MVSGNTSVPTIASSIPGAIVSGSGQYLFARALITYLFLTDIFTAVL